MAMVEWRAGKMANVIGQEAPWKPQLLGGAVAGVLVICRGTVLVDGNSSCVFDPPQ